VYRGVETEEWAGFVPSEEGKMKDHSAETSVAKEKRSRRVSIMARDMGRNRECSPIITGESEVKILTKAERVLYLQKRGTFVM